MLRGMNGSGDAENFLRARDSKIVVPTRAKMGKPRPPARSGCGSQHRGASAAVKIDRDGGLEFPDLGKNRRENCGNVGIIGINLPKAVFNDNGNFRLWPPCFQQADRRGRQNAVTQRAKANQEKFTLRRKIRQSTSPECRRESDTRAGIGDISGHSNRTSVPDRLCRRDRSGSQAVLC